MSNCNCSAEADILSKYKDIFPAEFIESVRKGVSWLCTHNNITYQTSIMVASDRILYNTAGSSVLRIGLINTDAPLTGLTYYEVKSIEVTRDEISNSVIFNVKMKYNTPMGINVVLVPITYFDPEVAPDVYNKAEIDSMLAKLQVLVDSKADAESTNAVLDTLFNSVDECAKLESVNAIGGSVHTLAEQVASIKVDDGFVEEVKDRLNGLEETVNTVNTVLDEVEEKYATKVIPTLQKGKSYKAGELVFKPVGGSVRLSRVISNIVDYNGDNSFVTPFLDSMSITDYPLIRPFIEGQPLVKASTYLLSKNGLYCSLEDIKNVTETDLEDPSKFIKSITFSQTGNVDLNGYATEDYVNDEIAKVQAGGADLTQYLKVDDAVATYVEKTELAEYAKTADVEQKIETESESITNIVKSNNQNVIKKQNYVKGIFLNTCDYVIYNNKVYTAKVPFMITGVFADDESKLFDMSALQAQKA